MNQTNSNTGPIPFDLLPDSAEIGSRGELLIGGIAVAVHTGGQEQKQSERAAVCHEVSLGGQ